MQATSQVSRHLKVAAWRQLGVLVCQVGGKRAMLLLLHCACALRTAQPPPFLRLPTTLLPPPLLAGLRHRAALFCTHCRPGPYAAAASGSSPCPLQPSRHRYIVTGAC